MIIKWCFKALIALALGCSIPGCDRLIVRADALPIRAEPDDIRMVDEGSRKVASSYGFEKQGCPNRLIEETVYCSEYRTPTQTLTVYIKSKTPDVINVDYVSFGELKDNSQSIFRDLRNQLANLKIKKSMADAP